MASSADGSGIAWSSLGDGPPLLRAGHWMTHQELDLVNPVWRAWIARLGRGRRLIRYDPRGTGMSARDCCGLSEDKLVEDLGAVADAAGLERFSIFAASQSASVACIYAARNPERIDKLILYGGFTQGSELRDGEIGRAMTRAFSDLIRKGWGSRKWAAMRSFSSLFMPQASEAQIESFIDIQVASASAEWAAELREVCSRVDVTAVLPRVRAPVLVAHALHDALQPFSQAQLFARLLPDASLLSIDSGNHILVPEEPGFTASWMPSTPSWRLRRLGGLSAAQVSLPAGASQVSDELFVLGGDPAQRLPRGSAPRSGRSSARTPWPSRASSTIAMSCAVITVS